MVQRELESQDKEGWGTKIIDQLAADLKHEFPDMKGFSPRNLKYMRKLAAIYPEIPIVQQAVAQISRYLPGNLKSSLPSIEELERELAGLGNYEEG